MFIELTIAALDGKQEDSPSQDEEAARLPYRVRLLLVVESDTPHRKYYPALQDETRVRRAV